MANVSIPTEKLRQLARVRTFVWLKDYVLNWVIIIATFWAFDRLGEPWLTPLAALIIGARQHAFGLLAHDAAHRLASKSRWCNELLAEPLTAWLLTVKMHHGYRQWHFRHHRALGTGTDPELGYRGAAIYEGPVSFRRIALCFFLDMCGLGVVDMYRFYREVFPRNPRHFFGPLALWVGFFAACLARDALWVFLLWSGSLLTGFWAVFRVRTWTEHVGVEIDGKSTSHRFSAGPFARFLFFPHHTYCHFEHHKWPQIPYYNLPQLRALDTSSPVVPFRELLLNFERYSRHPTPRLKKARGRVPTPSLVPSASSANLS